MKLLSTLVLVWLWHSVINYPLTHWGQVTHICVSDLTSIGSDNGLLPGRRQAIIRTNAGTLLIRPSGTNFSEFVVEILIFSFKKMRLKVLSAKSRPFCLGLNELTCLVMKPEYSYRTVSIKTCLFYLTWKDLHGRFTIYIYSDEIHECVFHTLVIFGA